jgi:hypothetical protein
MSNETPEQLDLDDDLVIQSLYIPFEVAAAEIEKICDELELMFLELNSDG